MKTLERYLAADQKASYPLKRPSEENLKRFIKATEKKSCLGCVPWGNIYSCEKVEELEKENIQQAKFTRLFLEKTINIFQIITQT